MAMESAINSGTEGIAGNIATLVGKKKSKRVFNINDIVEALSGDNTTLFEKAKSIDVSTKGMLGILGNIDISLSRVSKSLLGTGDETTAEQKSISLSVAASGDAKEFMNSLFEIVSMDSSKINSSSDSIENLGDAIDKMAGRQYKEVASGLDTMGNGVRSFKENMPSFKDLAGIAGGIALMGLAIVGVISAVRLEDVIMLGLTFGAVAIASKQLAGTETNLLKASLGVATLGLAIWAFNELITAEAIGTTVMSLMALGGAAFLFDKMFGKSVEHIGKPLIILALGIAGLGLATQLYSDVEFEDIGKMALALAGVGLAGKLMSSISIGSALTIAMLAVSVGLLGFSLSMFKDISMEDVGVALMALGGVALVAWAIGQVGKTAIMGALSIAIISLSLGLLAWGLTEIKNLDLTWEDAAEIAAIVGLTAGAFALIGIPVVAALIGIGAVAMAAMSVGLLAISAGLWAVSKVDLTEQQASTFANSLRLIFEAMTQFDALELIEAGLGSVAMLGLAVSTIAIATGMALLSVIPIPGPKTVENFKTSLRGIGDALMQFDAMELIELGLVTPVMLALGLTAVALGTSISIFSLLSTDRKSVDVAIGALDGFLAGLYTTFEKYDGSAFDMLKTGIDATMNIGTLLRNLAFGVSAIALAMSKNTDFGAIGRSVGSMLSALTAPLVAIGGAQDTISIGGFEVTNPFSNKVEAGIEALSGLTSIFTPIADMVKVFAGDKNGNLAKSFGVNLGLILNSIGSTFATFALQDAETEAVAGVSIMAGNMTKFIRSITGAKYEPAMKGLTSINVNTKGLSTSINQIDLKKLSALNDLFKHMADIGKNDAIEDLIKALNDFLTAMDGQTQLESQKQPETAATIWSPNPLSASNLMQPKKGAKSEEPAVTTQMLMDAIAANDNEVIERKLTDLVNLFKMGTAVVKIVK